MSQRSVERAIGRLVTDEAFRRRYTLDPDATIQEVQASGLELNACEARALAVLDPVLLARFADDIDPCLQRIDAASPLVGS